MNFASYDKFFRSHVLLISLISLSSCGENSIDTDVPFLSVQKRSESYQISLAIRPPSHPVKTLSFEASSIEEEVKLDISSFLTDRVQKPHSYSDISGYTVNLKPDFLLIQFEVANETLPEKVANSESGNWNFTINGERYTRRFHRVGSPTLISHSQTDFIEMQNRSKLEWESSRVFNPSFEGALFVPVRILNISIFGSDNPLDYLAGGIDKFNEVWGAQCNIWLNPLLMKTFQNKPGNWTWPLELRPEIFSVFWSLNSPTDDFSKFISVFNVNSLGVPTRRTEKKSEGIHFYGGLALDFNGKRMDQSIFQDELEKIHQARIVLTEGMDQANIIAHEVGHIILEQGHDENNDSLMAVGGGSGKNILTETQCSKARAFIKRHF